MFPLPISFRPAEKTAEEFVKKLCELFVAVYVLDKPPAADGSQRYIFRTGLELEKECDAIKCLCQDWGAQFMAHDYDDEWVLVQCKDMPPASEMLDEIKKRFKNGCNSHLAETFVAAEFVHEDDGERWYWVAQNRTTYTCYKYRHGRAKNMPEWANNLVCLSKCWCCAYAKYAP